jgi:hypothetical protein
MASAMLPFRDCQSIVRDLSGITGVQVYDPNHVPADFLVDRLDEVSLETIHRKLRESAARRDASVHADFAHYIDLVEADLRLDLRRLKKNFPLARNRYYSLFSPLQRFASTFRNNEARRFHNQEVKQTQSSIRAREALLQQIDRLRTKLQGNLQGLEHDAILEDIKTIRELSQLSLGNNEANIATVIALTGTEGALTQDFHRITQLYKNLRLQHNEENAAKITYLLVKDGHDDSHSRSAFQAFYDDVAKRDRRKVLDPVARATLAISRFDLDADLEHAKWIEHLDRTLENAWFFRQELGLTSSTDAIAVAIASFHFGESLAQSADSFRKLETYLRSLGLGRNETVVALLTRSHFTLHPELVRSDFLDNLRSFSEKVREEDLVEPHYASAVMSLAQAATLLPDPPLAAMWGDMRRMQNDLNWSASESAIASAVKSLRQAKVDLKQLPLSVPRQDDEWMLNWHLSTQNLFNLDHHPYPYP